MCTFRERSFSDKYTINNLTAPISFNYHANLDIGIKNINKNIHDIDVLNCPVLYFPYVDTQCTNVLFVELYFHFLFP